MHAKKIKREPEIKPDPPTPVQLDYCKRMEWEYTGDGYFYSKKKDCFGYFVDRSFKIV